MCQTRDLDLNNFFNYENQPFPPSLSNDGELYETQKSNIICLLEDSCDVMYSQPMTEEMLIDHLFIPCLHNLVHLPNIQRPHFLEKFPNIAFIIEELM